MKEGILYNYRTKEITLSMLWWQYRTLTTGQSICIGTNGCNMVVSKETLGDMINNHSLPEKCEFYKSLKASLRTASLYWKAERSEGIKEFRQNCLCYKK